MDEPARILSAFTDLLDGGVGGGVFVLVDPAPVAELRHRADEAGWRFIHLECASVVSKADYLDAWRVAADFPDWFGANWDALWDLLTDLDAPPHNGCAVVIESADQFESKSPADARAAQRLLAEVCDFWADAGSTFAVLTRTAPSWT